MAVIGNIVPGFNQFIPSTTTVTPTPGGTASTTTGGNTGGTTTLADGTTTNLSTNPTAAGIQAGLAQTNIQAAGNAAAEKVLAAGYTTEAGAYGTAGAISAENARVAGYAGDVLRYQTGLDVLKTTGQARAAIGASGAQQTGSAVDLLRSSYQQGALAQQLVQQQTALDIGGYLAQQAATNAEGTAAQAQAASAGKLADIYSQEAAQASGQLQQLQPIVAPTPTTSLTGGNAFVGVGRNAQPNIANAFVGTGANAQPGIPGGAGPSAPLNSAAIVGPGHI
jgi:hypothetical protein